MIPNFFILGAPKCGTTALSMYLRENRNVFVSTPKEPNFFDVDINYPVKINIQEYLSLFSKADPTRHKAVGEASVSYLFSKRAVKEILAFNPEAKFIVMLRNPVELVPRWHTQMMISGQENLSDFQEAWYAQEARARGEKIPFFCREIKRLMYSDWGKLGEQMERLFSLVERDRIKVILFDDFVADTQGVYEQVLEFLGVPPDGRTTFPQINKNKTIHWPWMQRILRFVSLYIPPIKKKIGLTKGLGIFGRLLSLNVRQVKMKPVPEKLLIELNDFYREDIKKLSKLLNRDLSHWSAGKESNTR
jgi:hypothetical protein